MNTPIQKNKKKLIKCRNCKCEFDPAVEGENRKCGMCLGFYYPYIKKPKMSDEEYQKILIMANVENIENAS